MSLKLIKIFIMILIVSFFIKYHKKIYGKYRWLKRKYKRKIFYLRKKYYVIENKMIKRILSLFCFVCYLIIILVFLKYVNIIEFRNKNFIPVFNFEKINIEKDCYEFLWTQISASLIVSTIVSLLSIFSTNYLYGKKQINVIFNNKSLLSLGKIFIYLVILIFVSLGVCLKQTNYYIVFICFIISISLVFYMLFKIIIFYTHPFLFKRLVKSDYIERERRHIKKAKPLESHGDVEIQNLKEITMVMIQKNDNDYNININAIMDMIETSLLSNSKKIQEYYTEMITRTDFISSILEIISHLIKYNKISEANHLMSQLYSRLKFYRVILIQDYFSYSNIMALINSGKYIVNENDALDHYKVLWYIINYEIYFVYLYECELDLSYCRLGNPNHNYIYYITHNDLLEEVYLSIKENKHLTHIEKERIFDQLYDDIRMMEHKEEFPEPDIRHYWKDELNKEKIEIPLIIKGEPIVLMLLKMFEFQDIDNLKRYKTMNASKILMTYLVSLTTLSLIEFINKNCIREYVNDLNLTKTQILDTFINSKFHNITITVENLKKLYIIFIENYVNQSQNRVYHLLPRLTISKEVINNYFYFMFKDINQLEEFYILIDNDNFTPNSNIIKIITSLKVKNKLKYKN
jgi:hypothetical protein